MESELFLDNEYYRPCVECGEIKPIDEFIIQKCHIYKRCIVCTTTGHKIYQENGINTPDEMLNRNTKLFIKETKEILTHMGYDINEPINPQFLEVCKNKYGIIFKD
jgi:hypothetical protein